MLRPLQLCVLSIIGLLSFSQNIIAGQCESFSYNLSDSAIFALDFTSGPDDISSTGLAGTVHNAAKTIGTSGEAATAYSFNNSDSYIDYGDNLDMGTSDFTVSIWIKAAAIDASPGDYIILKGNSILGDPPKAGWGLRVFSDDDGNHAQFLCGGPDDYNVTTGPANIETNQWHHLIAQRDGLTTRLYVDNELVATGNTGDLKNVDTNFPLTIGAVDKLVHGVHQFFDGSIDEVHIFDHALDSCEIAYVHGKTKQDLVTDTPESKCETFSFNLADSAVFATDFSSGADDVSPTGLTGTVHNANKTEGANGDTNSAYDFNGTDSYIDYGDNLDMGTSDFTVTAWIKAEVIDDNPGDYIVLKGNSILGDPPKAGWGLRVLADNEGNHAQFLCGGPNDYNLTTGPAGIQVNQWHHLVAQRQGLVTRLFVDNELVATGNTGDLKNVDTNFPLTIGAVDKLVHGVHQHFDGTIDEVYIFDYALDTCEIGYVYETTKQAGTSACELAIELTTEHTSCGQSNGSISASTTGDATYLWNNGKTNATINNLAAGAYTLTVTVDQCNADTSVNVNTSTSKEFGIDTTAILALHFSGDAQDASDSQTHGQVTGATLTTDMKGRSNSAYNFNGQSDYIDLGDVHDMGTSDFTLSAWFYAESVLPAPGNEIVNKGTSKFTTPERAGYGMRVQGINGKNYARFLCGGPGEWIGVTSENEISLNKWHHIVAIREGTDMRLYIDNALEAEGSTGDLKNVDNNYPLAIGVFHKLTQGKDEFFDGSIDEVYIFDRALDKCERSELYKNSQGEFEPDCAQPEVEYSANQTSCGLANGSIDIGGLNIASMIWSNGSTNFSQTGLKAGEYMYTATSADNCPITDTVTILNGTIAVDLKVITINPSCGLQNGAATVTSTTGQSFLWSTGNTTSKIGNLAGQEYSVTVSYGTCLSDSAFTLKGTENNISLNETVLPDTCGLGLGAAEVAADGGSTWASVVWSNGQTGESVHNLDAGSYGYTVTDDNNCAKSGNIEVENTNGHTFEVTTTDETCGASNGSAIVSSDYTVLWSDGSSTNSISGLAGGAHSVSITYGECSTSENFDIQSVPKPILTISSEDASCGNENGTATVEVSNVQSYTVLWSTGSTSTTISELSEGTYTVTVNSDGGCSETKEVAIDNLGGGYSVKIETWDESCSGIANGRAKVIVLGAQQPVEYKWSNGNNSFRPSNLAAGTNSVTITDGSGCSTSREVEIGAGIEVEVDLGDDIVMCYGGQATLQPTEKFQFYTWNTGQKSASIKVSEAGDYRVIVKDFNGCTAIDTVNVSLTTLDELDLGPDTTICEGATFEVSVDPGYASYRWSTGNKSNSIWVQPGVNYYVTATDNSGCQQTGNIAVAEQKGSNRLDGNLSKAANGKGLKNGWVRLYRLNEQTGLWAYAMDARVDKNGEYLFPVVPVGQYKMWFHPDSINDTDVMKTYLGGSGEGQTDWDDAGIIDMGCNEYHNKPIAALEQSSFKTGGSVSGGISGGSAKTGSVGLEEVAVYLVDAVSLEPIMQRFSDEQGHYNFENVPNGTYFVKVDMINYTQADDLNILYVGPGQMEQTMSFEVSGFDIYTGEIPSIITGIQEETAQAFVLYPNPGHSFEVVSNSVISTVEIMDLQGRNIRTMVTNGNRAEVNASYLATGSYLVRINGTEVIRWVKR